MLPYLKTVNTETQKVVDSTTGELMEVETKSTEIVTNSREQFVQLYISIESKLQELSPAEEKVFMYCVLHCEIDNIMKISQYDKVQIQQQWDIAPSTVSNALRKLHSLKLCVRISRGVYRVNPTYVWKSNSNDRKLALVHFLKIECPNC
jgi:hypothetical protein